MRTSRVVSLLRRVLRGAAVSVAGRTAPALAARSCAPVLALLAASPLAFTQAQPGVSYTPGDPTNFNTTPSALEGVEVIERRGETIDLDVMVTSADGERGQLRDYFDGERPVLLNLVYYECPMLCGIAMADTLRAAREAKWQLGEDYRIVTLSFDHTNTIADAATRKAEFAGTLDDPGAQQGWSFLVTDRLGATRVTDSVGFAFQRLENGEFSHPTVAIVLTPEGVVSTYLYGHYGKEGASFNRKQVELSLQAAAEGSLGNVFEQIFFACYVHTAEGYVLQAFRVMQLAGGVTVVTLGSLVGSLFLWERRRRRLRAERDGAQPGADHPRPATA